MLRPVVFGALAAFISMTAFAEPVPLAGRGELVAACSGDVQRFCQGIKPGQGRIRVCIRSNRDRLSEPCKAAIMSAIEQRQALRQQRRQQWMGGNPPPPPRP